MRNYAVRFAVDWTMHCCNFVTYLASLFLFLHINKIHLVNTPTEWCITNAIGIIKASWRHRLTNQLSLYVQRPAVSGPRNFRISRSISISAVLQMFVHGSCEKHFCIPQFLKSLRSVSNYTIPTVSGSKHVDRSRVGGKRVDICLIRIIAYSV